MTINENQLRPTPLYKLRIDGYEMTGMNASSYSIHLGPWNRSDQALKFSSFLTDTRIGEQLCIKFGVESIKLIEIWT
jgi:hypothetical protein